MIQKEKNIERWVPEEAPLFVKPALQERVT